MPAPPQVGGEIAERRQRRRQDRTDGEATDGTHRGTVTEVVWIVPILPEPCLSRPGPHGSSPPGEADRVTWTPRRPGLRVTWGFGRVTSMVGRIPVMDVSPLVDLGRLPAKATAGESVPVRATVFREGHDRLGAEVVLVAPDGSRRAPVRMVPDGDTPDRYVAWVTPDREGAWSFEVHAWSDPLATWEHDAGLKIPAGVDVELMFTEGGLLLDRVASGLDELDPRTQ